MGVDLLQAALELGHRVNQDLLVRGDHLGAIGAYDTRGEMLSSFVDLRCSSTLQLANKVLQPVFFSDEPLPPWTLAP